MHAKTQSDKGTFPEQRPGRSVRNKSNRRWEGTFTGCPVWPPLKLFRQHCSGRRVTFMGIVVLNKCPSSLDDATMTRNVMHRSMGEELRWAERYKIEISVLPPDSPPRPTTLSHRRHKSDVPDRTLGARRASGVRCGGVRCAVCAELVGFLDFNTLE